MIYHMQIFYATVWYKEEGYHLARTRKMIGEYLTFSYILFESQLLFRIVRRYNHI